MTSRRSGDEEEQTSLVREVGSAEQRQPVSRTSPPKVTLSHVLCTFGCFAIFILVQTMIGISRERVAISRLMPRSNSTSPSLTNGVEGVEDPFEEPDTLADLSNQISSTREGNLRDEVIGNGDRPDDYYNYDDNEKNGTIVSGGDQGVKNWRLEISAQADRCRDLYKRRDTFSKVEYAIYAADCGWGYDIEARSKVSKIWRVAFIMAERTDGMLWYTGCPTTGWGGCPWFPNCSVFAAYTAAPVREADVAVAYQWAPRSILKAGRRRNVTGKPYRVILWREALWPGPSESFQQEQYDFEMGTHYHAGIPNPNWLMPPSTYLSGRLYTAKDIPIIPPEKRPYFGIFISSHCNVNSLRDHYIAQLEAYLGTERVHRYGACGNRTIPPRPISNAVKLIHKYKYYFAFENTIQEGYVTEKLLEALVLPVVPVYYGHPNALNITKSPSYIKASDFPNPKALGDYLLHLDSNLDEYNKYHAWRTQKFPFTEEYLTLLKDKIPGPAEVEGYALEPGAFKNSGSRETNMQLALRRAACCRLCDEEYVKKAVATRNKFTSASWTTDHIIDKFFGGEWSGQRPGNITIRDKTGHVGFSGSKDMRG